jgi:hypothetical protein
MTRLSTLSLALLCALWTAGCNPDPRTTNGQAVDTSAAAATDQAKQAVKQQVANQRIMQKINQTRVLPNGQPLPTASNPGDMQPPGFHG